MKKNTLTIIVATLFCIFCFLMAMLYIKKHVQKKQEAKKTSITTNKANISPEPILLSKVYRTETGVFQFQYPESWFLVETGPESANLSNAPGNTGMSTNSVTMDISVQDAPTGLHLSNFVQCDQSAKGCSNITFNGQPYKVTEMSSSGKTVISYETNHGAKSLTAKVNIGEGLEKQENVKILTAILDTFDWK
jgi:hypothetical protein